MKVTAKSNIKYDGVWYHAGDVIEVDSKDIESFGNLIDKPKEEKVIVEEKPDKTKLADMRKSKAKVEE